MRCVRRGAARICRDDPAPAASAARYPVTSRCARLDGHRDCGIAGWLGSVGQQRPATRPRHACEKGFPTGRPSTNPAPDDRQRALLERYVRAWEGADLDGFVALLREDAILSMPPWRQWYLGREAIRAFFAWAWDWESPGCRPSRLVPIAANRQPAFALYRGGLEDPEYRAHGIELLTLQDDAIAVLTVFRDLRLFAAFGLPVVLPTPGIVPTA